MPGGLGFDHSVAWAPGNVWRPIKRKLRLAFNPLHLDANIDGN